MSNWSDYNEKLCNNSNDELALLVLTTKWDSIFGTLIEFNKAKKKTATNYDYNSFLWMAFEDTSMPCSYNVWLQGALY